MSLASHQTVFPVEIILIIVSYAAHSYVLSDRPWVASLCLLCHTARRTVIPVLYRVLDLGGTPISRPIETYSKGPLFAQHTRVLVARQANLGFAPLIPNIKVLVCSYEHFWAVHYYNRHRPEQVPRPKAVFLTTDFDTPQYPPPEFDFARALRGVTHLALPLSHDMDVLMEHLPSLHGLSHVLLEVLPQKWDDRLEGIVRELLERLPNLERVLCRIATWEVENAQIEVQARLSALGDERVAFDDDSSTSALTTVEDLFARDALDELAIWNSGRIVVD
ncbi:hypothetical protein EXIGLDRAFT_718452 [Exidia glandulosa HHB12029]|uniref:F-box domain-containing protein n=1 Tax=Exidia glandulosa HHB12029 TaxID=1314781 RepID=A0A165NW76_EXIGL|nr:hypothetical protein EXIGLDRAFT_718452 [Exidia glandulosa HHB12029]